MQTTRVLGFIAGVAFVITACGGAGRRSGGFGDGTTAPEETATGGEGEETPGPGSLGASSGEPPPEKPGCVGLQCNVHDCGAGKPATSITGKVYDPAGKNPLYNVVVYVPNAAVQPLAQGATCDKCDALYSGSPLVAATTDAEGNFKIDKMPDGKDVPLVIQVGKWRRQITIPSVAKCENTTLADKSVRLPKNNTEGDIPQIAISTGSSDSLECLLRRVGIDASEYTGGPGGNGRIHIFSGGGTGFLDIKGPNTSPAGPASSKGLWTSKAELMKYDMVLLSCEGTETSSMKQQELFDYAAAGGRVFASHFHYSWFNSGPFGSKNLASWTSGTNDMGDIKGSIVTKLPNGNPFPKGEALSKWLGTVGALQNGELPITQAKHNADVHDTHIASQTWIKANSSATPAGATQYFTFNTPIAAKVEDQCGRVVFSDLHVGAASGDYSGSSMTVPNGCGTGDLSAQEKALEFMLFDLSSCVTPDNKAPPPPPTTSGPK